MKKILSVLLILALGLGIFSGCGRTIDNSGYKPTGDAILLEGQDPEDILPPKENTQELLLAYYPERSLNPLFGSDYTNRVLMSLMYQGLFAVSGDKKATPILCANYRVSANNRTWTIYLEENAHFSDGSPVTAQDVVASYTQAKENDYYSNRFYHLTAVEANDDGSVTFYLDTDYQNFPLLMDVPIVKASDVQAELPLGTGAYIFTEGIGGAKLLRVANWWCGDLEIPATDEAIDLVEVSSVADVRDAFQFGNVSVVCTNPMSASFAEYRCDYELWEVESGYMMYIGCNILWSKHFKDSDLSTYLTYAIDRETFAQQYYKGMVDPVTLPCAPSEAYYNNTLAKEYGYDSLKFMEKLRGFEPPRTEKSKEVVKLRILVNSNDSARVQIARDIAETLTDLGLPATTLECTSSVFRDALYYENFDIYLGMTRLSPTMDLTEFFRNYGEMSRGGLVNGTLYSMTKSALENEGNYFNLYKKLVEDGRIIPVLFGNYFVYAQRGLLPDLAPARDNVFYYSMGKTMEDCKLPTEYD